MLRRVLKFGGYALLAVLANTLSSLAQSQQDLNVGLQRFGTGNLPVRNLDALPGFYTAIASTANATDRATAEADLLPRTSAENPFGAFQNGSNSAYPARLNPPSDPNQAIYYKNKLEFSLEGGWLPINIPFPFDFLLGDGYNFPGLYYTLVPVFASLRWQLNDVSGPRILRGNWDTSFTASVTIIPRGAEKRYFSYIMGIRRNFVPHRWKAVPYLDGQIGLGNIDAKGPYGVKYAQGQNFTFTLNLGSGVRYNLNPRYSIEAGMHYMHISNLYLSEPKFLNYGINVYGPWAGINIRIGKDKDKDRSPDR